MTNTMEQMRHKISGAEQLESVVRTMKAQAASSISQYENAVLALGDYYRTVELGLIACFRHNKPLVSKAPDPQNVTAIVFGSDQGLVGKFNDQLADRVNKSLQAETGKKTLWAVGQRVCGHLNDAGLGVEKTFDVPASITSITPLIGQILSECVSASAPEGHTKILIFYNRLHGGSTYEPASQQLLPLDAAWQSGLAQQTWPGNALPETLEDREKPLLSALIREYLFISLYRACAESLASENASRLAAMQRAEKNIDTLLGDLKQTSRTLRQNSIDEELFDVIANYDGAHG
ncbi:MAG: F0F1 ATP synthase subunit gamma [Rhodospirillales bacterium]|nr:F0F1 ATP synthase subunit gamma [Rhodospirillales bacterium]MCB9964770.1 F0F1 ATP synthase subunit gamma [Rhodospirillales bacterium]MCB9973814.1 F0F1 ATP synthase subunit gamma [Rhodospirillales bacterium]